MKNNLISFLYKFPEDRSKIFNQFSKQKMLKTIFKNNLNIKFINSKNFDEVGANAEIIVNNTLKIKVRTISSNISEDILTYSNEIYSINEQNISSSSTIIAKFDFHNNINDNSTIVIIEVENYISQNDKMYLSKYFGNFCESIKRYNQYNSMSQIILDSNLINRPIYTIKNNLKNILTIFSQIYCNKGIKKNLIIDDFYNNEVICSIPISKIEIFNEEIEILLEKRDYKIKISIVSLSEISCYVQIMEKFEQVSTGNIIFKISLLNKSFLNILREYFEHYIPL